MSLLPVKHRTLGPQTPGPPVKDSVSQQMFAKWPLHATACARYVFLKTLRNVWISSSCLQNSDAISELFPNWSEWPLALPVHLLTGRWRDNTAVIGKCSQHCLQQRGTDATGEEVRDGCSSQREDSCVGVRAQSCLTLCSPTDGTARQASLPVVFSRQKYWSGLPFPLPEDLPDTGMETASLASPTLTGGFFIH